MNRRHALMIAGAAALPSAAQTASPMQLHCDLTVEPSHEGALKDTYEKIFRPAIRKQPGFVDVKLMKLSIQRMGAAPAAATHRLLISFQTEKQRETWVATAAHQEVWPRMEKHLKLKTALVYDIIG